MVRKLLWVALLAVVLVPVGAGVGEAATINCVTSGSFANGAVCDGISAFTGGQGLQSYVWRFYQQGTPGAPSTYIGLIYEFGIAGTPTESSTFQLRVTDYKRTSFSVESPPGTVGYVGSCVPTFDATSCGTFGVSVVEGSASWIGQYEVRIAWSVNEDPSSRPESATLLKTNDNWATFSALDDVWYDKYPNPGDLTDPAIGGKGDNFSEFGVFTPGVPAVETVPEPASLLLVGTGLAGAWLGRRRRNR